MTASTDWNTGTPATAGIYNASAFGDSDMRRAWSPETGWSGCYYDGDPPEIVERAVSTPADRGNLRGLKWREVPSALAAAGVTPTVL